MIFLWRQDCIPLEIVSYDYSRKSLCPLRPFEPPYLFTRGFRTKLDKPTRRYLTTNLDLGILPVLSYISYFIYFNVEECGNQLNGTRAAISRWSFQIYYITLPYKFYFVDDGIALVLLVLSQAQNYFINSEEK